MYSLDNVEPRRILSEIVVMGSKKFYWKVSTVSAHSECLINDGYLDCC